MPQKLVGIACPICGSISTKNTTLFSRCPNCQSFIRKNPDINELSERYQTSWDNPKAHLLETGATEQHLAKKYVKNLCQEIQLTDLANLKILDYGAGRGELTKELLLLQVDTYAYEPFGHKYLRDAGIKVFKSLDEISVTNYFDIIINIDVIEHVINPLETLDFIKTRLKPEGYLYTATPNCRSLNAIITGDEWREAQNPGHLCLFSSKGMGLALENVGFINIKRLNWIIDYSPRLGKRIGNWMLTNLKLDGELRYICQKSMVNNHNL